MSSTDPRDPTRSVAIVGMACVMPGAPDMETYWGNILDGVDSVTEVVPTRWRQDLLFDPDYSPAQREPDEMPMSVSKWGGFIPSVGFDALRWGIPPNSLASIDPAQLMALKAATDALDDAGYMSTGPEGRPFDRDQASVIYATGSGGANDLSGGYLFRLAATLHQIPNLPQELLDWLPDLTEDTLPGVLTSIISGRVANRLDLGGKNFTLDSACASVLAAVDIARTELLAGTSDLVLCGGVDLHNGGQDYVSFTAAGALSPTGRCRSFDATADGMTLAEGAGCVVLKRLSDAERDGDRIYAVLGSVAGSSDGRHKGLTAPRQEGQMKSVRRAYAASGVSPADIRLIEAHGTGTAEGDRTELRTTTEIFREAGAEPGSIVIGSVKSNIGHVKCASGMASLIKTAKALYHGVQPATLHIEEPNPEWDPETSPFVFLDKTRPWLDERRLAAVSGFGFGGTNFHGILENHRPHVTTGRLHWPAELFPIRAASEEDLNVRLDELSARLEGELTEPRQADRYRLRDMAAAVTASGTSLVRTAIVARDLDDLAGKVTAARTRRPTQGVYVSVMAGGTVPSRPNDDMDPPEVAFLVPGPESAQPGMAADLLVAFPELREVLAAAPREWTDPMLPPQAFGDDREKQQEELTEVAQPATVLASLAVARALVMVGIRPKLVAGYGSSVVATPQGAKLFREAALGGSSPRGRKALRRLITLLHEAEARARTGGGTNGSAPAGTPGEPGTGSDAEFVKTVRHLADQDIQAFVELGPGRKLTDLVQEARLTVVHGAVPTDLPGEHGLVGLLRAVGMLAAGGVTMDLGKLHDNRDSDPERWLDPPKPPLWLVNGHRALKATGESLPKGLQPSNEAPLLRIEPGDVELLPPTAGAEGAGADAAAANGAAVKDMAAVTEYLRTIHSLISAGSDIIRHYADAGGAAAADAATGNGANGTTNHAPAGTTGTNGNTNTADAG